MITRGSRDKNRYDRCDRESDVFDKIMSAANAVYHAEYGSYIVTSPEVAREIVQLAKIEHDYQGK